MSRLTKVDSHGVVEYRVLYVTLITILAIAFTVMLGGYLMYLAEVDVAGSNISTWRDGTWVVTMIMTTIGFGDFYPISTSGRVVCWTVFIVGALEIGTLIGLAGSAMGTDKSIQNRELRTMLCEVMRKLEHMEKHTGMSTEVTKNSHNLDIVFSQSYYDSLTLTRGYLTIGKDSTGIYMLAVDAYDRETGQEVHRWIPESSRESLEAIYNRYLRNAHEL